MIELTFGPSRVTVLPVVRGLLSEAEKVRNAVEELQPQVICVSISKEELTGLRELSGDEDPDLSEIEWALVDLLNRFGEVMIPPPCFTAALEESEERGLPIIPLDMNEELYSATYVTTVGTMDVMKESLLTKRLKRIRFDTSSPENLAKDWDRKVNRSKGFQRLQGMREEHMARVIWGLIKRYDNILAIVECERAQGVVDFLEFDLQNN